MTARAIGLEEFLDSEAREIKEMKKQHKAEFAGITAMFSKVLEEVAKIKTEIMFR